MPERPDLEREDPLALWSQWLHDAEATELNDPNAAALATSTRDGHPSVRMVLIKQVLDGVFDFFTNTESQKGQELRENSHAALCFHWKSLRRQVRAQGEITVLPPEEVDRYFHSRSRRSQLGAAVSRQSRPLGSRAELEQQVEQFGLEHPEEVPRPDFWQGFSLRAERLEFWADGPDRLHDRMLFTRKEQGWSRTRLYP